MLNFHSTISPPNLAPASASWTVRYRGALVVAVHVALLGALASALYCFGIIRYLPTAENVARWDVYWYEKIVREGYTYSTTSTSSAAFFPLLPYLWRFTGLSALGMGLLNTALFLLAFGWLVQQLQLPARVALLLLSTPSLLFMIIPYTEALFFVFGTLLLLGLHRRKLLWWVVGLLGCGLTRSASTMFTPALLFTVLLWASQPGQARQALRWGAVGMLSLGLSVGVVAGMQWQQVGEPFAFAHAQKHWGHVLGLPSFPLFTPSGIDMLWLDALALWVGLAAVGVCCWLAWRWVEQRRQRRQLPAVPSMVVFSLGYCVCIALFILLYQGGSIWNIGRYILATPFFVVLVWYLTQQPAWPRRRYAWVGAATLVYWQAFGIYTRGFDNFTTPQALWYFGLVTAYLLAYLMLRQLRWQREVAMLLYVFNLVALLHLLESFLQYYVVQ